MLQHTTQILYFVYVADSGLLEFNIIGVQHIFIDCGLRIVTRVLFVVRLEAEFIVLGAFHDIKTVFDLFQETLR